MNGRRLRLLLGCALLVLAAWLALHGAEPVGAVPATPTDTAKARLVTPSGTLPPKMVAPHGSAITGGELPPIATPTATTAPPPLIAQD